MVFDSLYRELKPALLRYLCRLTSDGDAAEDVAQEAFVRLLRRPELKGDDARIWLFTVATNLARDRGRTLTRRKRLLEATPPAPTPAPRPDVEAERAETIASVRAALAELTDRDRQLLLMREEGFRYDEIAAAVGVAPGSVGTLVSRALKRFGAIYREDAEGRNAHR
jgi:RNA polymerase sigma-70 factor (ECF subfamily)